MSRIDNIVEEYDFPRLKYYFTLESEKEAEYFDANLLFVVRKISMLLDL